MSDADELAAEIAAGRALALHHPARGLLPMAHAFATDDGIAFAEPGWDHLLAAGTRPLHAVVGRVRRSGAGWTVEMADGEQAAIVPLDDAKLRRLRLEDWSPGDRDLCLLLIRQSGGAERPGCRADVGRAGGRSAARGRRGSGTGPVARGWRARAAGASPRGRGRGRAARSGGPREAPRRGQRSQAITSR